MQLCTSTPHALCSALLPKKHDPWQYIWYLNLCKPSVTTVLSWPPGDEGNCVFPHEMISVSSPNQSANMCWGFCSIYIPPVRTAAKVVNRGFYWCPFLSYLESSAEEKHKQVSSKREKENTTLLYFTYRKVHSHCLWSHRAVRSLWVLTCKFKVIFQLTSE